jgi:hypothetical protein
MKIELIKEVKANDEAMYYTNVDGHFVDKSLSFDYDKAKQIFDNIVKNNGEYDTKETIESVTILCRA